MDFVIYIKEWYCEDFGEFIICVDYERDWFELFQVFILVIFVI